MRLWIIFIWMFICPLIVECQKLKVVSSASIFNDMVQQIGGDLIEPISIVPIGSDPHLYEPKPSDAQLLKDADVIFINGLTFEGWINEVIENSGTKAIVKVITNGIKPIAPKNSDGSTDPHAWMSAKNGLIYIENIYQSLCEVAPYHKNQFTSNYNKYYNEIKELDEYITKQISTIKPEFRVLITSHDAFAYYGQQYGMKLNAVIGISTESDAQTQDLLRVINSIKSLGIPAIFIESTINPKMLERIAQDTGTRIGGKLYADSLGDPGGEAGTYTSMLKHNTDTIVKALNDSQSRQLANGNGYQSLILFFVVFFSLILAGVLFLILYKP